MKHDEKQPELKELKAVEDAQKPSECTYCLVPSSLRAEDCLFDPDFDWDSTYWDDR